MSNSPRDDIIKAILTNNNLTEDEKSKIIGEFMDEFKNTYPNLEHHATKQDVSELELKLTKEIENTRKEIKELDVKMTQEISNVRKEIKELDVKMTQEISNVRKEIKELDVKLTKEIKELDVKLTKEIKELDVKMTQEISNVRKEIKDLDVKLGNTKVEIIKWVAGMMLAQVFAIGGLFFTAFKIFLHP
jgi:predicted transposase YbfD/YdcC